MSRIDAMTLLHQCLEEGEVIPGPHFMKAFADEGLTFPDAFTVLKRGSIHDEPEPDIKTGEWKYRVEGHEPDGKWLCIVFSFKTLDTALLITAWSLEARRKR